ncbi:MAG: aminotransferase, partial [Clostridia bacterium]|nr:aminotransferase [Clostridia bacterium]
MNKKQQLIEQFEKYKAMGLKLDMSRGKPSAEQVSTMERLLTAVKCNEECFSETGSDCRNYGGLDGINEMKRLLGEMLGVGSDHIIVGGNSSLNLM